MALQGYNLFAWGVEVLIRVHGISRTAADIGSGGAGILGSLNGGGIANFLIASGYPDGIMRQAAIKCLAVGPVVIALGMMPTPAGTLSVLVALAFLMSLTPRLGAALVQTVAPSEMPGKQIALHFLTASFLSALVYPLGAILLFAGLRSNREALRRIEVAD